MKNSIKYMLIAVAGLLVQSASAEIIVLGGYSGQGITADVSASDITATNDRNSNGANTWLVAGLGSDDQTFGNFAGAALTEAGGAGGTGSLVVNSNSGYVDYTFTNTGSFDYDLNAFHLDAWRRFAGSPQLVLSVVAGGSITSGDIITTTIDPIGDNSLPTADSDFKDVDISLTGLADYTLDAGESVTFRLTATSSPANTLYLDNVALTGTQVIPEPGTLSLLVISAFGLFLCRRYKRG